MKGFKGNIEKETIDNNYFRRVLYSAKHMQLVLMCLHAGEEIGEEIHAENDQFFRVESGEGQCIIDGHVYEIKDGDVVIVPAGAKHNVINTNMTFSLKLYTIYAPAHHKDQIVRATKAAAESQEAEFDGKTTE